MVKSTSPLRTTASSFTFSVSMRPTTSGATWIVLAVTIASVVRGRASRRRRTRIAIPMHRTMDDPKTTRPAVRRHAEAFCSGDVILMSVPGQPDHRGDRQAETGIDDQSWTEPAIDLQHREELEHGDSTHDPEHGAQHPRREERAEDVQGRAVHVSPVHEPCRGAGTRRAFQGICDAGAETPDRLGSGVTHRSGRCLANAAKVWPRTVRPGTRSPRFTPPHRVSTSVTGPAGPSLVRGPCASREQCPCREATDSGTH